MEELENNRFLIPNLCDFQALLLLITTMQLLVILDMLFLFGIRFDWVHFGLVTIYVQLQTVLSAMALCLFRAGLARIPIPLAASLAFFILLSIAFAMALFVHYFWLQSINSGVNDWHFVWRNVLVSSIISAMALRYLYVQQQLILQQKAELKASLLALQARIRPHFLFNTLNSIASLISIAPDKAERMIEDLSTLIRASLRENVESSFEDEWQLCEAYLQIEKIRLDSRLQWRCEFDAMDMDADIPSLSLQPLLENAIYHGIQPNPQAGDICIKAKCCNGHVTIVVENSKALEGENPATHKGHNMAVDNIRHRLKRLYGEQATLTLQDLGERFTVSLNYTLKD